jgi:hypothetical protein
MEEFLPVGTICYDACLFNPLDVAPRPLFATRDYLGQGENLLCIELIYLKLDLASLFVYPTYPFSYHDLSV